VSSTLKYGGYYPPEAEELAQRRYELRKQGRYSEGDVLKSAAINQYNVEIQDLKDGWALRWWDRHKGAV
jgi:hypothetical protein